MRTSRVADLATEIARHLTAARCVLVVWTGNSVSPAGEFVHDEADQARRRGVLLPVMLDGVTPPVGFGQIQSLDLTGWTGNTRDTHFITVTSAVAALLAGGPRPSRPCRRAGVAWSA